MTGKIWEDIQVVAAGTVHTAAAAAAHRSILAVVVAGTTFWRFGSMCRCRWIKRRVIGFVAGESEACGRAATVGINVAVGSGC